MAVTISNISSELTLAGEMENVSTHLRGAANALRTDKKDFIGSQFEAAASHVGGISKDISKEGEQAVIDSARARVADAVNQVRSMLAMLPADSPHRALLNTALQSVESLSINTVDHAAGASTAVDGAKSAANAAGAEAVQDSMAGLAMAAAGVGAAASVFSGGIGGLLSSGASLAAAFPTALSNMMDGGHEKLDKMLADNPSIRAVIENAKGFIPEMLTAANVSDGALFSGATGPLNTAISIGRGQNQGMTA